jgi:hypothetical protein
VNIVGGLGRHVFIQNFGGETCNVYFEYREGYGKIKLIYV